MGILKEFRRFIQYADNRCAYCGKVIKDPTWTESYVSFIKFHNSCFEKYKEAQVNLIEEYNKRQL